MRRPLFLEGEAGVGKTELAKTLAAVLDVPLIRLQCYEGLDAAQALYDWDFPRQLLHLRAAEAAGVTDVERLESELYDRRFLVSRPLLQALETSTEERPAVLLVDEIDRADDEFEAFLLEVLSDFTISVPELGTISAERPPVVVVTSNRTREVHDALKRRCLYHWLEHPAFDREVAIIRRRMPEATESLVRQVAGAAGRLRKLDLLKAPGIAESLDWTEALVALGARDLDPDIAAVTLGAVLKYREDTERVVEGGIGALFNGA
jgi:MoxR-like ATPase